MRKKFSLIRRTKYLLILLVVGLLLIRLLAFGILLGHPAGEFLKLNASFLLGMIFVHCFYMSYQLWFNKNFFIMKNYYRKKISGRANTLLVFLILGVFIVLIFSLLKIFIEEFLRPKPILYHFCTTFDYSDVIK